LEVQVEVVLGHPEKGMGDLLDAGEVVPPRGRGRGRPWRGRYGLGKFSYLLFHITDGQEDDVEEGKKVCFSSYFVCRPQLSDIS